MNARTTSTLLAVAFAVIALFAGLHTGNTVLDTDEAVYQRTLREMRTGAGYYRAMSDALAVKEGARPDSVRAIRPPTEFLLLRWLPTKSWRWVVGIVYLAVLLGLARLGEPYGQYGGLIAVVAGGVWMIGASSYLYLHADLWGLPFFVAGLVAARREDDVSAAVLIAAATIFRELYGLAFLIGLVMAKRRSVWLLATGVVVGLAGVHYWLARGVLAAHGHEVSLGNEPITFHSIVRFLSPGDRTAAFALGIGMLACGFVGLARNLHDRAARILLPFAIVLLPLGIIATRAYWNLTYGPAVSAFIAAAFVKSKTYSGRSHLARR
jgi:hypothetical protein